LSSIWITAKIIKRADVTMCGGNMKISPLSRKNNCQPPDSTDPRPNATMAIEVTRLIIAPLPAQ
jgi:hypothetical protein